MASTPIELLPAAQLQALLERVPEAALLFGSTRHFIGESLDELEVAEGQVVADAARVQVLDMTTPSTPVVPEPPAEDEPPPTADDIIAKDLNAAKRMGLTRDKVKQLREVE